MCPGPYGGPIALHQLHPCRPVGPSLSADIPLPPVILLCLIRPNFSFGPFRADISLFSSTLPPPVSISIWSESIHRPRSPSVAGSEPHQTLLFETVSEYVSLVARVDSGTQESQRGRNGLSCFEPIGALLPAADNPYTQEHSKSGVTTKCREIWWGVSSVLILRLPHRRWSLLLVGEEEDDGCSGAALGAPL